MEENKPQSADTTAFVRESAQKAIGRCDAEIRHHQAEILRLKSERRSLARSVKVLSKGDAP